jgi:DNA-binding Xre family transcriptional regulator
MSVRVDAVAFKRMLHERCMTGEELRTSLGLSPATLAKLNRGADVREDVFHRVVLELEGRPVKRIAQELAGVSPPGGGK